MIYIVFVLQFYFMFHSGILIYLAQRRLNKEIKSGSLYEKIKSYDQ
jgi:hypothetical protein